MNSEQEEEVSSLKEEIQHVHKDKKRRRNDSEEEDEKEKPVRVKKLQKKNNRKSEKKKFMNWLNSYVTQANSKSWVVASRAEY